MFSCVNKVVTNNPIENIRAKIGSMAADNDSDRDENNDDFYHKDTVDEKKPVDNADVKVSVEAVEKADLSPERVLEGRITDDVDFQSLKVMSSSRVSR